MTANRSRDWRSIGCAALAGALIAFPAGVMLSRGERQETERRTAGPPPKQTEGRNFYSPGVVSDPYVLEQQRRVVEALEVSCRQFRENCAEARLARQRIEEAAGD